MMGYGALILATILVAGFIFVLHYPPSRYNHKRSQGWHTYLQSGAWGLPFAFVSFLICWLGNNPVPDVDIEAAKLVVSNSTNESLIIGFSFLTPALAYCAGTLVHYRYYGLPNFTHKLLSTFKLNAKWYIWVDKFNHKAMQRQLLTITKTVRHDPFENLIVHVTNNFLPVMVTLKSRKVYIGPLTNSGIEHGKLEYVSVIPFISGYRREDDFKVERTVNYSEIYRESDPAKLDDFRTVLPISEIESIRQFDGKVYKNFQNLHKQQDICEGGTYI